MRVILRENVEFLGNVGDVVEVKPGYANNYLLPKGLVLVADEANVKAWKHQQRIVKDRIRKLHLSAQALAGQIEGQVVEVEAKAGEADRLFGSVGSSDIQKALRAKGFHIPRKDIRLDRPLKSLGAHPVTIHVHPEVSATITVQVVRAEEPGEARQSRTEEILEALSREEEAAVQEPASHSAASEEPQEEPQLEE